LPPDLQVPAHPPRDIKTGLPAPPKPTLLNMMDLALRPQWCWHMLHTKRRTFGNIVGHAKNVSDLSSLSSWTSEQFDPRLSWDDVARIKDLWGGKLIIKGIMTTDDAEKAAKSGADALIVSNHGGRQLDGALSTIKVLPDIVSAVGSQIEVWLDSGIVSGQDILKCIALGAKGTMIGKSFLYGLGAYGEDGVRRCLEILYTEMDTTMAFCGHTDIKKVGKEEMCLARGWVLWGGGGGAAPPPPVLRRFYGSIQSTTPAHFEYFSGRVAHLADGEEKQRAVLYCLARRCILYLSVADFLFQERFYDAQR